MPHVRRMARADEQLLARLSEPRTRGVRAWEYGVLLDYLERAGERLDKALDVGSGDSAFPRYLVASGAVGSVTALDLPDPFEERTRESRRLDRSLGVEQLAGSMLDIPVPAASFQLVTCISAIEHLDGDPTAFRHDPESNARLSYTEYLKHSETALREMARVLQPGGILYLTTDAYLPDLQRTDGWAKFDTGGVIWSAYRFPDIEPVFLQTLEREDVRLSPSPLLDPSLLLDDPGRSTFRGRYFTTFALLGRKAP